MPRLWTLFSVIFYVGAGFMAGMLVGQLYALYVLVYTGAVFMIGVYLGDRLEQILSARTELNPANGTESETGQIEESDELTYRKG